jgi:hypothetical protein
LYVLIILMNELIFYLISFSESYSELPIRFLNQLNRYDSVISSSTSLISWSMLRLKETTK